jgi:hypothetical protein
MHKATKSSSKRPRQDANFLAYSKIPIEPNKARSIGWSHQRLYDAHRNRNRLFASHDQRRDANSAIDGTPPVD